MASTVVVISFRSELRRSVPSGYLSGSEAQLHRGPMSLACTGTHPFSVPAILRNSQAPATLYMCETGQRSTPSPCARNA